jgi:multidrug transporter EmrE-like cation transporter
MNKMNQAILMFLSSVLVSSFSQILLKKSTLIKYRSIIYEYLNPYVIVAYAIFFMATILSFLAYRVLPVSLGPMLESLGYVFVAFLSYFIFHEKQTPRKMIGLGLIISGIIVVSI